MLYQTIVPVRYLDAQRSFERGTVLIQMNKNIKIIFKLERTLTNG